MPCAQVGFPPAWVTQTLENEPTNLFWCFPKERRDDNEFSPAVDVFDTKTAFMLHISLPGAKKEDIAVEFDPESNEIEISGIIHREGDEDLIQSLVIRGRGVGIFKKKYRLGTQRRPATVDASHITAQLEQGILKIIVPKVEKPIVERKAIVVE